eukprot:CAMPEP_0194332678 /NCGR_PEP_ID=MMETSP0171-20130528/59947_1 /TAXON_ID=218684 /ORGANISM="Corethron pennatum, Strain L29A3" /LENGTH=48 /DNA_ID= /DNA_START= /DNA_END= /DNA_ORIENTATION=
MISFGLAPIIAATCACACSTAHSLSHLYSYVREYALPNPRSCGVEDAG